MIVVTIWWNTDADGRWVADDVEDWDDLPRSYYGPFNTMHDAVYWMENVYPDGDTDVNDMIADDIEVDEHHVNSPEIVTERVGEGPVQLWSPGHRSDPGPRRLQRT